MNTLTGGNPSVPPFYIKHCIVVKVNMSECDSITQILNITMVYFEIFCLSPRKCLCLLARLYVKVNDPVLAL